MSAIDLFPCHDQFLIWCVNDEQITGYCHSAEFYSAKDSISEITPEDVNALSVDMLMLKYCNG